METPDNNGIDLMTKGEIMNDIKVTRLVDGLGFGKDDGISFKNRTDVTPEERQHVEEYISTGPVLVAVDTDKLGNMLDDDGCGDGRDWKTILVKVGDTVEVKNRSLNRAKQFGGGITMAAAGLIATGHSAGASLRSVFTDSIHTLEAKRLGFGAHTDDHAHGDNCGCGAIDKAPEILDNALKYEEPIRNVMNVLGIDPEHVNTAFTNIKAFVPDMDAESYSGRSVAEEIIEEGKVVKQLTGKHLEMYIVLNKVFGHTADQQTVRDITDDRVQIFSVDVWRMRQFADEVYDTEDNREVAFAGELIYTLATAGTLTAGDLPVYVIDNK